MNIRTNRLAAVVAAAMLAAPALAGQFSMSIHIGGGIGGVSAMPALRIAASTRTIDTMVASCIARMKAPVDRTERLVNTWRDLGVRLLVAYGARPPSAAKEKFVGAIDDRYTRLIEMAGAGTAAAVNQSADACITQLRRLGAPQEAIDAVNAGRYEQLARLVTIKTDAIEAIHEAADAAIDAGR
ncbi:MAG TPA: hypothetical protein VG797_02015 [Phycisphaerales bacterium]|nr:hypothetical protein [Phycisphaerales bacterium]